mgnify:FL=1|jgi:two-component system LytT family response regulator
MIDAIIIDDEEHCIQRLDKLLSQQCADLISVRARCNTVQEGLRQINERRPSLVFLDVMLNNETGFDLLKQLPEINFDVIFITAHDKYAIEAFRFSALDYLLKPVDPDELLTAVNKLRKKLSVNDTAQKLETLFKNLAVQQNMQKRIAVPGINGTDFIQIGDIMRCQSEGNYTIIFLKDNRKITVAKTLKEFEDLLCNYDFFRVHNSHIVNLAFVKTYSKGKSGYLTMTDDTEIEVATRRREEFMKKMLT